MRMSAEMTKLHKLAELQYMPEFILISSCGAQDSAKPSKKHLLLPTTLQQKGICYRSTVMLRHYMGLRGAVL